MYLPTQFEELRYYWHFNGIAQTDHYCTGSQDFLFGLLPSAAVQLPAVEVIGILGRRFGHEAVTQAMQPEFVSGSPKRHEADGSWLRRTNMVGINVRTIGSFWAVVKYALTLSRQQDSVHLLPIWEPGVVASLYGMTSWNINPEFFSSEWQAICPALDTVEKQLRACVNVLHLMGKTVGMDVIPHTDRYSEIVLANPSYFEWLQRSDFQILRHDSQLFREVERLLHRFVMQHGSAIPGLPVPTAASMMFADAAVPEVFRLRLLFGDKRDYEGRLRRRDAMVQMLFDEGIETVPATMGPPYRGLEVDPNPEAAVTDEAGRMWRDYRITKPEKMSRVFGPLTRYDLYDKVDNNRDWQLDFGKARPQVWEYVCRHYAEMQREFGFDFMRGDMSHVQMRPDGVPAQPDDFYDVLRNVKRHIRQTAPYFGYFAETFLAPDGVMAYGNEADHLEASEADTTLGDLQSETVGTEDFIRIFRNYLDLLESRSFAPNFTLMTGDKDDPRFDAFYLHSNEVRQFVALFLPDMPSYSALGFEQRDPHPVPAPNEHYTKLYVFRVPDGPKAVQGPYQWGQHGALFRKLSYLRVFAESHPEIQRDRSRWLIKPDISASHKVIAWSLQSQPEWLFVVNLDAENAASDVVIPELSGHYRCLLSTLHEGIDEIRAVVDGRVETIGAGEARVMKLI